jgi:hypothetical protein
MSLESTVGTANVGTRSLRAIVPECIVAYLGFDTGDKLRWKMDMQTNESSHCNQMAKGKR